MAGAISHPTLATRVVALERSRNRPEEKLRYGASIAKDIDIWPPRVAGAQTMFDTDTLPGQDDLTFERALAGTAPPT